MIMTTEILRNIMYRTAEGTADDGSSTGEECGLSPGYPHVRSGSGQTVGSVAAAGMGVGLLSASVRSHPAGIIIEHAVPKLRKRFGPARHHVSTAGVEACGAGCRWERDTGHSIL